MENHEVHHPENLAGTNWPLKLQLFILGGKNAAAITYLDLLSSLKVPHCPELPVATPLGRKLEPILSDLR